MCHTFIHIFYLHSYVYWLYFSYLHLYSYIFPFIFSCLPSSTCSIMCALCASARFRVTRFMSEAVVPIVRDTLIW